jgi:hypothetical protein
MHFYTLSLALLASTLPSTFATDAVSTNNNNLLARSDPAIGTALSSAPIANLYAYSS